MNVRGQPVRGRLHQGRMNRYAHGQRNGFPAPLHFGQLDSPFHRGFFTRDHHLTRRVEISRGHDAHGLRLTTNVLDYLTCQPEEGHDQPAPGRDRLFHVARPFVHQRYCVRKRQPARGHEGRIFAQTVPRHRRGLKTRIQGPPRDEAGHQQRGLGIFRSIELFRRPFKTQGLQVVSQDRVGLLKQGHELRIRLTPRLPHPDGLRTLAGKQECDWVGHRQLRYE